MRVGVTEDLRGADGRSAYDLSLLDERTDVDWEWMRGEGELKPDDLASYDAIVLFHPHVTAASLRGVVRLRLIVGLQRIPFRCCGPRRWWPRPV